jgi:hypothetical protein
LIFNGFMGFMGLVATSSGNKSTFIQGYLPMSFGLESTRILHCLMNARMPTRGKNRMPFIRLSSRIDAGG